MNHEPLDAPGRKRRIRQDGTAAYYWVAGNCVRDTKGFTPATVRLHGTVQEQAFMCRKLYAELQVWLGRQDHKKPPTKCVTISDLVKIYKYSKHSPFQKVKANTQQDYLYRLNLVEKRVGRRELSDIIGADFRRWYDKVSEPDTDDQAPMIRKAHGFITMLRILFKFGREQGMKECTRLRDILADMEFANAAARSEFITLEQVQSIIALAIQRGQISVALAQALQFDLTLRQSQVIGQWYKVEAQRAGGGIVYKGMVWDDGLLWSDISPDLILQKRTSKTGTPAHFDLNLYPMLLSVMSLVPQDKRVGPMIIHEATGRPYRNKAFGKVWRKIARDAGVPDHVWNRDSRAGGVTEMTMNVPLELARHHAQHSNSATTARYSRGTLEKTREAAILRMNARRTD